MAEATVKVDDHPFANALVSVFGVIYFVAWSYSFYPQLILNYKRKKTTGLSPDFIYINPVGFLALTIWSWGAYFSPIAKKQYQSRHDGHSPQISKSDLAFSLHALLISTITVIQVWYYSRRSSVKPRAGPGPRQTPSRRGEEEPLLLNNQDQDNLKSNLLISDTPTRPSLTCQLALLGVFAASIISAILVWYGKYQFLDWLYLISSIKLFISMVKYIPQVVLNWNLRSVEGFAIGVVICDLIGSIFSFAQLVVSSIYIDGDAGGIIANPAKMGLSALSLGFDLIFIIQKYWFFANTSKEDEVQGGSGDEED
ncbi:uncharacterized protein IL334_003198 [Kwoniella shivajii]|uniref:Cystinosin n=1 Tax=Kwoniella shivajii TaxID=564305 RepID=A0ABZ1CYJ8_9TREE|nr:hypothetical protein IL334_003198 [Kwoniella shivajii]